MPSFTPVMVKPMLLTVLPSAGVITTPLNSTSLPSVLLAVVLPLPVAVGVVGVLAEMVRLKVALARVVVASLTVKAKLSGLLSSPPWRYLIRPAARSAWVKVLAAVRVSPASAAPLPFVSLNSVPLVGAVPRV